MKPENLLLDANNNIKIVDFGLGNLYQEGQLLQTACGSPCYAAPEMIAGKKYKGIETDVWSSGIILFAMICGHLPFEDKNTSKLYEKILKGEFTIPNYVSFEARDLLEKLLIRNPKYRITINHIRSHSWFSTLKIKIITNSEILKDLNFSDETLIFNEYIIEKMTNQNLKKEYIQKCLKENKHNHITANYYLYLKHYGPGFKKQVEMQKNTTEQAECKKDNLNLESDQKIEEITKEKSENEKLKKKFSSVKNPEIFPIHLKNGYLTINDDKINKINTENIPKSFDISFNKGYFMEANKPKEIDINKSFRIKSLYPNKQKSSLLK